MFSVLCSVLSEKCVKSVNCKVCTQEIGSVGTWRANTIWVGCGIGQGGEPGGWGRIIGLGKWTPAGFLVFAI